VTRPFEEHACDEVIVKRWKNVVWAVGAAVVACVVTVSCGGGNQNPCTANRIQCESPLTCDPADGKCKCGGRGGIECQEGFVCDPITNTCQSTKCARIDCSERFGTSCDVNDGMCKCGGTGGAVCAVNEQCNPLTKTCVASSDCRSKGCNRNEVCEESTGRCLCGSIVCSGEQSCFVATGTDKECRSNPCKGISCTGANVCDSADGYCKCNGVICQTGEACACPLGSDGGVCDASMRSCRVGVACFGVSCSNGTTCDPVDGQCKCGGPGGPQCGPNQICSLGPPAKCQGGAQCTLPDGGPKVCSLGTSCDPEDGVCKCGGRGGVVCAPAGGSDGGSNEPAEVCVQNPNQRACRRPCDIRSPDCVNDQYCYFDSSATTPASYCATPTDMRLETAQCNSPTACFSRTPANRSLHCNGLALGQNGLCRAYCDVAAGNAGCLQVPMAQRCIQITGAPTGYGYCQP
jgi:hypothetical protein